MKNDKQKNRTKNALKRDAKGRLVKGTPPGPGRPKGGVSIKDLVRKHLEENPEDLKEFVEHFIKENRELAWQMLEGRPSQDVTTAGDKIQIPIYGGVSKRSSNKENIPTEEKD